MGLSRFLGLAPLISLVGCGYSFQNTRNPLLETYGIRRIYVAPLRNDTYKPGVENLVYNELVRVIAASRRVKLVPRMEDADAVLVGSITQATYSRGGGTTANRIFPTSDKFPWIPPLPSGLVVATEYSARLNCVFSLNVHETEQEKLEREREEKALKALKERAAKEGKTVATVKPSRRVQLWAGGFGRAQPFPGNNQGAVFGTTSSLINESEFDRALGEMARNMMADVHESMLAMF